jgi:hypothetical protein
MKHRILRDRTRMHICPVVSCPILLACMSVLSCRVLSYLFVSFISVLYYTRQMFVVYYLHAKKLRDQLRPMTNIWLWTKRDSEKWKTWDKKSDSQQELKTVSRTCTINYINTDFLDLHNLLFARGYALLVSKKHADETCQNGHNIMKLCRGNDEP